MQTLYFTVKLGTHEWSFVEEAHDIQSLMGIVEGIRAGLKMAGITEDLVLTEVSAAKRRNVTYVNMAAWVES